jgi:hypothetical protein
MCRQHSQAPTSSTQQAPQLKPRGFSHSETQKRRTYMNDLATIITLAMEHPVKTFALVILISYQKLIETIIRTALLNQ